MLEVRNNSILIVDDETSNIIALTHILQSTYTIYVAKSGKAGVEAAKKFLPDVILLDVIMPEMDGYEAIAALKSHEKTANIPVIFITGLSDADDEEKGFSLGAADYITKPFSSALVRIRVLNQIKLIEQFHANEYDIMKYKLSNDALNIALWDMEVLSEDPVNPSNEFTWSQEFRRMLGFSSESDFPNLLQSWSERIHPDDRARVLNAFAEHVNDRSGRNPYDIECRLMMKSGEYRNFHALGTTRRDADGVPLRVAGALRDITAQKRMERDIADSMAKIEANAHWYKSILDAIPLPVKVVDSDMCISFSNKAVEGFLGVKREEIIGKPCRSICRLEICGTEKCGAACAVRGTKQTFFNRGESSYQADVEILRSVEGEPAGFIEIIQDVTNIHQLAKERAEAEMTSQAKSAFLANMSHEIRTPMNAIWGIIEILMQDESLSNETMEKLSRIHNSCELLLGIINDILDFSKIEAGKLDIFPAQYNLASLINDAINLNTMRNGDKPIEFELQVDENVLSKMVGDELRIKQILNNLLSNAFKYTDTGKITLKVDAQLSEKKDSALLVLIVKDTGRGMTKEQVNRLFEEYSRFNDGTNRTIEGTGLGMTITNRLLSLMNGEIIVESEPDKGSTFTVLLPQGTAGCETLGKEAAESLSQFRMRYMSQRKRAAIAREPMPYGSVLIVDDVETNLYVAQGLMKPYKIKTDTALSGFEALDKVRSGKTYDIIFMDHMMPKMDGIEATKLLREMGYKEPIVALTANAMAGQADMFLQNGFDGFISKPIDVRNLNAVLNKLVRDKQPPEVIEAAGRQVGRAAVDAEPERHMDAAMLSSFMRDVTKALAVLSELFSKSEFETEEGLKQFIITVHGIKSALANIGEAELSESARTLEYDGRAQNIESIKALAPEFLESLGALLKETEMKTKSVDDDGDTCADSEGLAAKLSVIRDMCADYNRKGALDAVEEIKQGGCSKQTREFLEELLELILPSEFEEAEKAIADYIESCTAPKASLVSSKKIDGLDIIKGLERYHGDEETYLKILRSYAGSVRAMLGTIEAVGQDELADYKITVHGIKGASFDIFAEQIGQKAKALEAAAASGDLDYVTQHNSDFLEAAHGLLDSLDDIFRSANETAKPEKLKPDDETLLKLLAACKVYDMDGADAAMDEIDAYRYTADDGLALWLRENVDIINFEEITQRLSYLN
ncbi:MAG: response regulator [Oscillospiraceae bacterium]|nr:response regulator [Oscillospiraceae bacterium]